MDAANQAVGDDDGSLADPVETNGTAKTPAGGGSAPPVKPKQRKPVPPRPYWVPDFVRFHDLPKSLQVATTQLIKPSYEELVLGAPDALERSAGDSLVLLLWYEVLGAIALGRIERGGSLLDTAEKIGTPEFEKLLKVISEKMKVSNFILRLRKFRAEFGYLTPTDGTQPFRSTKAR